MKDNERDPEVHESVVHTGQTDLILTALLHLTGQVATMDGKVDDVVADTSEIKKQATLTNGRVGKLELAYAQIKGAVKLVAFVAASGGLAYLLSHPPV